MSGKSRSNRRRGDRFHSENGVPPSKRQAKPPARCPADGCGKIPYPSKVTASKARADLRRTLGLEPGELETLPLSIRQRLVARRPRRDTGTARPAVQAAAGESARQLSGAVVRRREIEPEWDERRFVDENIEDVFGRGLCERCGLAGHKSKDCPTVNVCTLRIVDQP